MQKSKYDMSPKEWLDYKRKINGYDKSLIPIETLNEELHSVFESVPSKLESLIPHYSTMTRGDFDDEYIDLHLRSLNRVLRPEERERTEGVFVGIYPTYEIKGYADRTPRGDRIIMLHSGLLLSISLWADMFIHEINSGNENFIEENIESVLQHLGNISKLWIRNRKLQKLELATLMPPTVEYALAGSALSQAAGIFILGHEFGHIIENHYNYDDANQNFNHQMEYDADLWGLRFCVRHVLLNVPLASKEVHHSKLAFLGPFLALGLIAAISNIKSSTHPSASDRFSSLKRNFKATVEEEISVYPSKIYKYYLQMMGNYFDEMILNIGETVFKRHIIYGNLIRALDKGIKKKL